MKEPSTKETTLVKRFHLKKVLLLLLLISSTAIVSGSIFYSIGRSAGMKETTSYKVVKKKQIEKQTLSNATILHPYIITTNISNWKTYSCSFAGKVKFSIQYPPGWYIVQPTKCSDNYSEAHEEFQLANSINIGGENSLPNIQGIDIIFDADSEGLTSGKPITSNTTAVDFLADTIVNTSSPNLYAITGINERNIGGKTAYQLISQGVNDPVKGSIGITRWAIRIHGGFITFDSLFTDSNNHEIADPADYETILNTFKFQ